MPVMCERISEEFQILEQKEQVIDSSIDPNIQRTSGESGLQRPKKSERWRLCWTFDIPLARDLTGVQSRKQELRLSSGCAGAR